MSVGKSVEKYSAVRVRVPDHSAFLAQDYLQDWLRPGNNSSGWIIAEKPMTGNGNVSMLRMLLLLRSCRLDSNSHRGFSPVDSVAYYLGNCFNSF